VSAPLTLAVRELGGTGAPLVVLHGLLGSARNWQSAGVALAERGHRVVAPDLRNHGVSPWGDDCGYAALAGDVVACLERLAGPTSCPG
jgi:pimeloyl-ACP methyl ester carboxylesterase